MEYREEYFDIEGLLGLDVLNLSRFAEDEPAFKAQRYFALLSQFLDFAPGVRDSLDKFALLDGERRDYKNLSDMAVLLEKLKCYDFLSEFYSLLDAYEKGNWRLASVCAKKTKESFVGLYKRLNELKTTREPEAMAHYSGLTLSMWIKELDEAKAANRRVILVVDDSPVHLRTISAVLGDEYKVYTLPKPMELERVLKKVKPDLFLLDYLMPERNGFELIPVIRACEGHSETPIIFITSLGTMDNVSAALTQGACDFVVKPYDPEGLRARIARHIGGEDASDDTPDEASDKAE